MDTFYGIFDCKDFDRTLEVIRQVKTLYQDVRGLRFSQATIEEKLNGRYLLNINFVK